jgi:hypothetical protein
MQRKQNIWRRFIANSNRFLKLQMLAFFRLDVHLTLENAPNVKQDGKRESY